MDKTRLAYLEKRYWAGETSLDEERELKEAVKNDSDGVSEELMSLFQEINRNTAKELNADFDSDFWNNVDSRESGARIFTLSLFLRYAAVGVILLGLTFAVWSIILNDNSPEGTPEVAIAQADTFDDPEVAFEETKKALMFASQKLNKGKEPIREIKRFYNVKMSIAGMQADTSTVNTNKEKK